MGVGCYSADVPRIVMTVSVMMWSCSSGSSAPTSGSSREPVGSDADNARCVQLPFAESAPVAEASGAAWLTLDGKLALVVAGDSGNHGDYVAIDPETGALRERGKLPLGDAPNDDLEGLASRGDKLYGILSAGWIWAWERRGGEFALVDGPYPIGPVELPDKGKGETPPDGDGMVCPGKKVNCGRNYEGICIVDAPHASGPCAGFVASKADGRLYCLVDKDGRFAVERARSIQVARPGVVADCAFSDDGSLYVGGNVFDLMKVYRVTGWSAPETAKVEVLGTYGVGNPEVIAVRGDIIYRMSDTNTAPSLMAKFRCRANER
jgi:outer membrane protein assembly factor BamB